jgi:putative peptide zinc metalloprotease protein
VTATAEPPRTAVEVPEQTLEKRPPLDRAEGAELLGGVHGSGYKEGAALVRRGDGQMVHLGPLMYGLLEAVDGERDQDELAAALSHKLGRRLGPEHVERIAQKLAAQGLLAGFEDKAPPKRNPLLALRWKVLVTNPKLTRRLTAPFTVLFRPWLMWPILACFVGVFWFVLFHKGVASATAEAFHDPGLLLLVFALAVASAGFHELGHAAACRYGGATPGGMGMGLYLVWPAFYTDVTDTYRLPRRDRLRVDLGGLYFNAVVAVVTTAIWLAWRNDALLLLVALQVLQMVKQLSPVIRADGYHILSDATGVPDLFSHMGPTMRRLLPGHRHEPSALTGRARLLVTLWVLIVMPVLLSLSLGAVLLLPKLATTAWDSGRMIVTAIPHEASRGQILDLGASLVRLVALVLPVLGSVLVTQKILRTVGGKAHKWSAGRPHRRAVVIAAAAGACAAIAWAWWPSGQYQPIRPSDNGTVGGLVRMVYSPATVARPAPPLAWLQLTPGRHLALAMIPVGGATERHPALFVIPGTKGKPPVAIVSYSTPPPSPAPTGDTGLSSGAGAPGSTTTAAGGAGGGSTGTTGAPTSTGTTGAPTSAGTPTQTADGAAFPFRLPSAPGPGGTQALAENTTNGGVTYDVAYSLVTISGGAPVTNTNSAYALAHCQSCTTVAVSFQVILIVGHSKYIAPINAAGSLNYDCPACTTTAIADQLVITLKSQPPAVLLAKLDAALQQLNALPSLGAQGSPAAIAGQVAAVQQEIDTELNDSGLPTQPVTTGTTTNATPTTGTTSTPTSSTTTPATPAPTQTQPQSTTTAPAPVSTPSTTPAPASTTSTTTTATTPTTATTTTGTTSTATSTTPAG